MAQDQRVLKRCAKCGGTSLALPRERRCKRPAFGKGSYSCWGELAVVHRPRGKWGKSPTCLKGDHSWCMNRSSEESHCSCPCHERWREKPKMTPQERRDTARQKKLARVRKDIESVKQSIVQYSKTTMRLAQKLERLERSEAALLRHAQGIRRAITVTGDPS